MVPKMAKISGVMLMLFGGLLMLLAVALAVITIIFKVESPITEGLGFLSVFVKTYALVVWLIGFLNGLLLAVIGQAAYMMALITERSHEANNYLRFIAKYYSELKKT